MHPIAALQTEYSLWTRDLEAVHSCPPARNSASASSPTARSAAAFSPALSRRPEDFDAGDYRRSNPRFSSENFASNLRAGGNRRRRSRARRATRPAQVALAWLLDCAPYIVPIPGTRSIKRLKENALSVMVRLQDAQLERLYGILRERPVSGARYTPPPDGA